MLKRESRSARPSSGGAAIVPIEISMPEPVARPTRSAIEIAVADVVLRVEVGTDVSYVAELVRGLGAPGR
jgi:hypothetical protein